MKLGEKSRYGNLENRPSDELVFFSLCIKPTEDYAIFLKIIPL